MTGVFAQTIAFDQCLGIAFEKEALPEITNYYHTDAASQVRFEWNTQGKDSTSYCFPWSYNSFTEVYGRMTDQVTMYSPWNGSISYRLFTLASNASKFEFVPIWSDPQSSGTFCGGYTDEAALVADGWEIIYDIYVYLRVEPDGSTEQLLPPSNNDPSGPQGWYRRPLPP